jgi:hypothetical protein
MNPKPENVFFSAGNNQDCSRTPRLHIKEAEGMTVVAVEVVVAAGIRAVQVREDTAMIVAKGADTARISCFIYQNVTHYCFTLNIYSSICSVLILHS